MVLFLQTLPEVLAGGAAAGGIMAAIMAFLAVFLAIGVALWIFISFAFMSIGKKAKYPSPGIAWIPVVGPALIAAKSARMHWWPILLLVVGLVSMLAVIGGIANLVFAVFFIIWMWKTFEVIGKPGWWSILLLIPIVNLIMLGIAAWTK